MIDFRCPHCGSSRDVSPDLAGKTVRCQVCDHSGVVSAPPAPEGVRRAAAFALLRLLVWIACAAGVVLVYLGLGAGTATAEGGIRSGVELLAVFVLARAADGVLSCLEEAAR